jgi:arylsulfatase A-like enzyme
MHRIENTPPYVGQWLTIGLMAAIVICLATPDAAAQKPNIIFIMADDLGYGDLGCYGQKIIKTPNLDRMAAEGMKFTDFYAGSTVCAPSRCVLMTGKHLGHCSVRGNADPIRQSLTPDDLTVANLLKKAGYATGMFGKWGLGEEDTPGLPQLQGFDAFFGYLSQHQAHNYYPEFLWHIEGQSMRQARLRNVLRRDGKPYEKVGAGIASKKVDYSHDLIAAEALKFLDANQDRPFFLYVPLTIPHANNEGNRLTGNGQEVPDFGPYADENWPDQDKGQAAMITRMDADIGRIFARLKKYGIDGRTVVMFTSDNGHHDEGGHDTDRFDPNGPLRGMKRDLYEGGIRVPMLARWPGRVKASTVSDHIGYFGDLMATAADLAKVETPQGLDSVSFLPTLLGQASKQKQHEYLYWEFYERGSKQAVRMGRWKAVRAPMFDGPTELFDLDADLGEENNIAPKNPDMVAKMESIMDQAHEHSPNWLVKGRKK